MYMKRIGLMLAVAGALAGQPAQRSSVRLENWGRIRLVAPGIIGWRTGLGAASFPKLTFFDAAARIDDRNVAYVVGSSDQTVSAEIPKKLDYHLAPGELAAVRERLRALSLQMPVYFTPTIGADRKLFEFAKT